MCAFLGHFSAHVSPVSPASWEIRAHGDYRTTYQQDGHLVYRVQVRRRGVPLQTATVSKLSDARTWTQVTEGVALEGRHFKAAEAKRRTLADLIERYIRDVLPHKDVATADSRAPPLRWWQAQLGHCLLADLTPARIAEHRDLLSRERCTNSTVNYYLKALSPALTIAVKAWGWLDDSPMRKVSRLREPRGRVRFLSEDERTAYLMPAKRARTGPSIASSPLHWRLRHVSKNCCPYAGQMLTSNGVCSPFTTPRAGNSGRSRSLGMRSTCSNNTRTYTTPLKTACFPTPTSTMRRRRFRDAWEYAVKRADIADFHFHDLRHTAVSYLAMDGASSLEIAEVLGHKTLNMVRQYAHLSEAHTRSVVERMNRAVFGEPQPGALRHIAGAAPTGCVG
jgi:integrase